MTWLSQADSVALVEGDHSFHQLALRWMLGIGLAASKPSPLTPLPEGERGDRKPLLEIAVKFFDYLEANAEEFWNVPRLDVLGAGEDSASDDELPEVDEDDDDDEE